jgi:glycosyltransferase involved in cell wall biosynthesis
VIFDAERMKYSHTGLYHFCWHLGRALIKNKPAGMDISVYAPTKVSHLFNTFVQKQNSLHKFWIPFKNKYDLWHVTYQGTNYFPQASKKKILFTVHDLNFLHDEKKSAAKQARYLASLQRKLNRADAITTISYFTRKELEQHVDLKGKEPVVIYNGSNFDSSLNPSAPSAIPGQPFIFTIGTIVDKKNFHVLPGLLINNNYVLVIAGIVQSSDYRDKIIEYAKKLGVLNRIIFTGPVSEAEKNWYLQNCIAFAFPSLAEGFGLPVIEAMACGKPVLLSGYTSLPEVGGTLAYYFSNFEPGHMSLLLQQAVEDFRQPQKAVETKTWAARFNWDNAAQQYLKLYEELVK